MRKKFALSPLTPLNYRLKRVADIYVNNSLIFYNDP